MAPFRRLRPALGPCPTCGEGRWLLLIHGMPGLEMMEASAQGDVKLAGCDMPDDEPLPDWECAGCGHTISAPPPVDATLGDAT